jgi:hypothetical protein
MSDFYWGEVGSVFTRKALNWRKAPETFQLRMDLVTSEASG